MNNRQEQIEQAKRLIATGISEELVEVLHQQFPELKESEDERIRNGLLKVFKQSQNGYWAGMEIKDIVAYLERQKEQEQPEVDLEKACDAYCKVCGHYPHTVPTYICRQKCEYFDDFKFLLNARNARKK